MFFSCFVSYLIGLTRLYNNLQRFSEKQTLSKLRKSFNRITIVVEAKKKQNNIISLSKYNFWMINIKFRFAYFQNTVRAQQLDCWNFLWAQWFLLRGKIIVIKREKFLEALNFSNLELTHTYHTPNSTHTYRHPDTWHPTTPPWIVGLTEGWDGGNKTKTWDRFHKG